MSELDIDRLRQGLTHYLEALRQHLISVQDQNEQTETAFQGLMSVQAGSAAEDYNRRWRAISAWLDDYVSSATQLAALLEERIGALEQIRA